MARLSDFTVNTKALEDGEWLSPGEEFDDFKVHVRGFGDAYQDMRAAKVRKAAINTANDPERIPAEKMRDILVDCLDKHVLIGISGLVHDSGAPVTREEFVALMRTPEGSAFFTAVIQCANRVGKTKSEATKEAAGNSLAP